MSATELLFTDTVGQDLPDGNKVKRAKKVLRWEFAPLVLLWPLVVLPKEFQFVILLIMAIATIIAKKKSLLSERIPLAVQFILFGCLVHLVSIMAQCALGNPDGTRLMAAFNTLGIWLIALVLYFGCRTNKYISDDFNICYWLVIAAFAILAAIYCFSLVSSANTFHLFGETIYLRRYDYLVTGTTTRFAGLMETVLGPSHLYCICAPILVLGARRSLKKCAVSLVALLIGYYVVVQTHSRIGLVICGIICFASVIYILCTSVPFKTAAKVLAVVLSVVLAVWILMNFDECVEIFTDLFSNRTGSNSARFSIYSKSIDITLEQSPVVGMGVKYMLGTFPYGSHCTYIGLFYKTGFLGVFCFAIGFIGIFKAIFDACRATDNDLFPLLMALCYMGLLVFADLDGSDWVICLAFCMWGLLANRSFLQIPEPEEEKPEISDER